MLPETQSGFRVGKSCTDNLVALSLAVENSFLNGDEVLAAFLDIRGAFDNVNVDILLSKLASLSISLQIVKFIRLLVYERNMFFKTSDPTDIHLKAFKGVPQGGVLSPLLYTLYVKDITKNISKNVTVLEYADDIALYTVVKSLQRSKSLIESSVNQISANLLKLGLVLSPEKTELMLFNRKGIAPGTAHIKLGDHKIISASTVRF